MAGLSTERRTLLSLLSRFTLRQPRGNGRSTRPRGVPLLPCQPRTRHPLENPYLVAERDLGGGDDAPVSLEVIDRGLLPDETIANAPAVPEPSHVASAADRRRVRCALVGVLRKAAIEGDSLLSVEKRSAAFRDEREHPILISAD